MRGLRGAASTVVLAVLVITAVAVGSSPARADDPVPSVIVAIDALTPLVPAAGGTLMVKGRVISTASAPLTDVRVTLRRSATPLTSRKDVLAVDPTALQPAGGEPADVPLPATTTVVAPTLAPGGTADFRIAIPFGTAGFGADGTYAIAVEATGTEAGTDTSPVRKGIERTFVPWYPTEGTLRPVSLVWLWPLADAPARSATGVLLDDRTPRALAPGGRLDRLVSTGARFDGLLSWVVDPALLQTASAMTRGYQVLVDGQPTAGTEEASAARWLDALDEATSGGVLRSVPYADVDASAVVRAGMPTDVVRAVTTGPGIAAAALRTTAPGGLYWAPFGRIDRATADVLASAGVTDLVLSADALPVSEGAAGGVGEPTAALSTSVGTVRAVLADAGLTAVLGQPQRTDAEVIAARQSFLAQTALIAQTLPADQSSRTVVVAPPSMVWDPAASLVVPLLRATRAAPWLTGSTLDRILDEPPSTTSRQRGGYGVRAREAELPPAYMAAIARVSERLASFTSILDDPSGVSEPYAAALLRAESAAWRDDQAGGRALVASIATDLGEQIDRVRVLSQGTVTLSGDTGRVPVTITNDLDRSVTVGVALVASPSLRLVSTPLTGIRIEAGKMASVDIDARVVGGDPLAVSIQLLDADGQPYGRPAAIQVASTAYARAAAWVVAVAFVAILVFVVVGVTRRIRKARAGRPAPDLGP